MNMRVTAATPSLISVAWDPSLDDVGVAGYYVFGDKGKATVDTPAYVVRELACGKSSELNVIAFDAAQNRSARATLTVSTAACPDVQPPTAPSGFTQLATSQNAVVLGWSASSDDIGVVEYGVYRDLQRVATSAEPNATLAGLACGSTYSYAVDAADAAGNRSSRASVFLRTASCSSSPPSGDTTPPSTPSGLAASSVTQTSLALDWNAASDNVGVVGYDVFRNGSKVASPTTTSVSQSGLACGTAYAFAVAARDAAGNTSAPGQLSVTTSACAVPSPGDATPPSAPSGLGISGATSTSVSLTWTASRDNVGVASYRLYVNGAYASTTAQLGATASGLTCGTAYLFEVDAMDFEGNESTRAFVTGSTTACLDTQTPTAPLGVAATSRTATSIALAWTASTDNVGVSGYGLYRAGSQVGTTSSTNAIFSGLVCNTNYTLAVDASDAAGNRSAKTTVMVATTACPDTTPPAAPSGLAVSNVTQTSLTLTWNASTDNVGVTGYDVYRNGTKMATVTSTSAGQTGLACGSTYTFGVIARDAADNHSPVEQVTASTASCPGETLDWLHPWPSTSLWRKPIPANPAIDPNNTTRISYWMANSVTPRAKVLTLRGFGVAVAVATPTSPWYTPTSTTGWADAMLALGTVPIPLGTQPDPNTDGHLAIWDPTTANEYDLYQAAFNGTNWSRASGAAFNTRASDGIVFGSNAACFPLLGGLIRPEEIEAGLIEHPLVFGMANASTGYVKPAIHGTGSAFNATALQAGNHLQLDPSINVDALAIQPWEKTIAKALQKYGMYLRDGGGALAIYAENPINRGQSPDKWSQLGFGTGNSVSFSSAFPWSQMRILVPPA
jgi:chitodextrinase